MSEQAGTDLSVEVGGQKFNARNLKDVNTVATITGLIVSICGFTIGWFMFDSHAKSTEKRDQTLIEVLKEQATAQRVTNCLISLPQDKRENALATCERISR